MIYYFSLVHSSRSLSCCSFFLSSWITSVCLDFFSILISSSCLQAGPILDYVEQHVEEQSLDLLLNEKYAISCSLDSYDTYHFIKF